MGATHFLTKTLERVSTEMSLHVLAYNLKRVMKILGIRGLIEAIRACGLELRSLWRLLLRLLAFLGASLGKTSPGTKLALFTVRSLSWP
jgi:hypothetical protein